MPCIELALSGRRTRNDGAIETFLRALELECMTFFYPRRMGEYEMTANTAGMFLLDDQR